MNIRYSSYILLLIIFNIKLSLIICEFILYIAFPQIKIFVWTGYVLDELVKRKDERINHILSQIDVLIDGPYIEAERDITLELRGSKNQRILYHGVDF